MSVFLDDVPGISEKLGVFDLAKKGLLRDERGLTLVELLVVAAILSFLAALIAPRVVSSLNEAKKKVAISDAGVIRHAMERYLIEYNEYPPNFTKTGESADSYAGMYEKLGSYANLPASEAQASFTFVSYYRSQGGTYQIIVRAKDNAQTSIAITPDGVSVQ